MNKPMPPHWEQVPDRIAQVIKVNRLGIISDFDGTLSHFTLDPEQSQITDANAQALDMLAKKVSLVALVSGRSAIDVRSRFVHANVQYHGNHGLDYWRDDGLQIVDAARASSDALRALLTGLAPVLPDGVLVENKGVTASVHYRTTANPSEIGRYLKQLLKPLCKLYGFQLNPGRFVWELKPIMTLNKGTVLQILVTDYRLDGVIFLGDDTTDLAAMQRLRQLQQQGLQGLSVGVVHQEQGPVALPDYCDVLAYGPDDVAELLNWIVKQLMEEV